VVSSLTVVNVLESTVGTYEVRTQYSIRPSRPRGSGWTTGVRANHRPPDSGVTTSGYHVAAMWTSGSAKSPSIQDCPFKKTKEDSEYFLIVLTLVINSWRRGYV